MTQVHSPDVTLLIVAVQYMGPESEVKRQHSTGSGCGGSMEMRESHAGRREGSVGTYVGV